MRPRARCTDVARPSCTYRAELRREGERPQDAQHGWEFPESVAAEIEAYHVRAFDEKDRPRPRAMSDAGDGLGECTDALCARGHVVKRNADGAEIVAIGCGRRTCKPCREAVVRRLKWIIREAEPNRVVTMTPRPSNFVDVEARLTACKSAWRGWVNHYRRANPTKRIDYFLVVEFQESGNPHLHIACCSGYLPRDEMLAWMTKHYAIDGVHIEQKGTPKSRARYIAKYLTKAAEFMPGFRSYSMSKLFAVARILARWERQSKPSEWKFIAAHVRDTLAPMVQAGMVIIRAGPGRWRALTPTAAGVGDANA